MARFFLLSLLFLVPYVACTLRVMNFNLWHCGKEVDDGIRKIADQIKHIDPDIVAIQEGGETKDYFPRLLKALGKPWTGDRTDGWEPPGIITKHKIVSKYAGYSRGMNMVIQLNGSGMQVSFWSVYLDPMDYGPYNAADGATTLKEVLKGEGRDNGRMQNIAELIGNAEFHKQHQNSEKIPLFVAGDFNTPSDLDWTEATKKSHYGWAVKWPATQKLRKSAGMTDSFREVHPDPVAQPGITWTVHKTFHKKEIKRAKHEYDRIDFIFYRGPLRATSAYTYSGKTPVLDFEEEGWKKNEWPSDHFAVIAEFKTPDEPNGSGAPLQLWTPLLAGFICAAWLLM